MMTHPIRAYREAHNLTQKQLAEKLGVSDATITHVENGRRGIPAEKAIEWETILGIPRARLRPDLFGSGV